MGWIETLILAAIFAWAIYTVVKFFRRRNKVRCSGCSSFDSCQAVFKHSDEPANLNNQTNQGGDQDATDYHPT